MRTLLIVVGLILVIGAGGCALFRTEGQIMSITREPFGETKEGTPVDLYTLKNAGGVEAKIATYGGTVVSLYVPDRQGRMGDVVQGFVTLEEYIEKSPYFGCLIGRYGNRIAEGKFTLEGETYTLACNDGSNNLHGGMKGFDKVVWDAEALESDAGPSLELKYLSRDGEEGFPGNLSVTARYTLTADNGLRLDFSATTDKPTVVNLTHHSYFNLAGEDDVLNHEVMIASDKFTPVDANLIPTGELRPVQGTPFDFTTAKAIGAGIGQDNEQLKFGGGYDHNWVLNKPEGELGIAARVFDPASGRVMEVLTTEPAMQFYTGNFLDGTLVGKGGQTYMHRSALCMEPQHYPDSPNQPDFPSVVLRPGEEYRNTIIYRFSVAE